MTVKEYLEQYRLLDNDIKIKQEQLVRIRELAEYVSPSFGGVKSEGISDKVGRAAAKLADTQNELNQGIIKLIDLKREIEGVIAKVGDPVLEQLLVLRYINGMTWEQIADEMFYTYKWVCVLHKRALSKIILPTEKSA